MRLKVNSYAEKRIANIMAGAKAELIEAMREEYQEAGDKVADEWSDAIPDGRGGSHNSQMKDITAKVSGGGASYTVRMGWLNGGPAPVGGGPKTWFVYHDTGYRAFGGPTFVSGLGNFLKMRSRLLDQMDAATDRVKNRVEAKIRG